MPTAPYGSWRSPISAASLTERTVRLSELHPADDTLWWVEARPEEGGRHVVVRRGPGGDTTDVTPEGFSARTRVHEYGGGATVVGRDGGEVWFANWGDQRLYRQEVGSAPEAVTPVPARPAADRYADAVLTPDGEWLVCVREHHPPRGEAVNEIVAVPAGGGEPLVLVSGPDFVAAPRLDPEGARLAWLSWDHPRMPWDGTELWVADLDTAAPGGPQLGGPRRVAGAADESVLQPGWLPDGTLVFVSDRTGWWNLWCERAGRLTALTAEEAEYAGPMWVFGQSSWCALGPDRIVAARRGRGAEQLVVVDVTAGEVDPLELPWTAFADVRAWDAGVVAIAASPTEAPAVVAVEPDGAPSVLRRSREGPVDPARLSRPQAFTFPTAGGADEAHALYYPPHNPDFDAPEGERPPLLVISHGGPTGAARATLDLGVQFWTSRGVAVVDVDYRGSTGYGRAYREKLKGQWGVADVEDCVAAARHLAGEGGLAGEGRVDPGRMAIRGGSAGGYTTLCALTFHDVFAAGVSRYGVADAEALARDTHKFESRYLDTLIGPLPEAAEVYRERSPIHHTERLSCPLLLLQGAEDEIVPPAQAQVMAEALRRKGLPFAYVEFEGEQHGFRRAENVQRAMELELAFYARVFGFEPADDLPPLPLENAEALRAPG